MAVVPCPDGKCLHHFEPGGHCTCRPDNRIYRTADDAATVVQATQAQARIDEALAHLERVAAHTFRRTPQGELIEALGCILTGRKGSWWPASSPQPRRRVLGRDGRVLSLPPQGVTE